MKWLLELLDVRERVGIWCSLHRTMSITTLSYKIEGSSGFLLPPTAEGQLMRIEEIVEAETTRTASCISNTFHYAVRPGAMLVFEPLRTLPSPTLHLGRSRGSISLQSTSACLPLFIKLVEFMYHLQSCIIPKRQCKKPESKIDTSCCDQNSRYSLNSKPHSYPSCLDPSKQR